MRAAGTIVGHVSRCVDKQSSWSCNTGRGANTCSFVPLPQADTKVRLTAIFETSLTGRSFRWRASGAGRRLDNRVVPELDMDEWRFRIHKRDSLSLEGRDGDDVAHGELGHGGMLESFRTALRMRPSIA